MKFPRIRVFIWPHDENKHHNTITYHHWIGSSFVLRLQIPYSWTCGIYPLARHFPLTAAFRTMERLGVPDVHHHYTPSAPMTTQSWIMQRNVDGYFTRGRRTISSLSPALYALPFWTIGRSYDYHAFLVYIPFKYYDQIVTDLFHEQMSR